MNLQPVSFDQVSAIQYEFFLETSSGSRFDYTLIARFSGVYRTGSSGAPDAAFINGMLKAAQEVWNPRKIIIDFSELGYRGGDEMDYFTGPWWDYPCALVVGPKCIDAISTLAFGMNSTHKVTERPHVFDNLEDAWAFVNDKELWTRLKQEYDERFAQQLADLKARKGVDTT
jgi:hypothetical protein